MGYGLSGGQDYIWLVLPYIEKHPDGSLANCLQWWGDIAETKKYCLKTIESVCVQYGGDRERIVLCGFSRGSIGCNYFRSIEIEGAEIVNQCTFEKIPFPNHSAEWLLCDLPQRESARKWLRQVLLGNTE